MAIKLEIHLTHNILKVKNLNKVCDFYLNNWGMKLLSSFQDDVHQNHRILSFGGNLTETQNKSHTFLEICSSKDDGSADEKLVNHAHDDDVYWKIGFNAPDVVTAVNELQKQGVDVQHAKQLKQSGFFTHLKDPEGYKIELLQFTFEGSLCKHAIIEDHPLKQQPVLGMISLRVKDIDKTLRFYCDALGMKLLCRVDESDTHGFQLYFTAFTEEAPPSDDIDAVENREWLFQRPYTVLEFLVYNTPKEDMKYRPLSSNDIGFMGIGMACSSLGQLQAELTSRNISCLESGPAFIGTNNKYVTIHDPDGIPIRFSEI